MNCPNSLSYVIQKGDNLYQIAKYYQTSVSMIISMNPGIDPYNLQSGMTINICPGEKFNAFVKSESGCRDFQKQLALINEMRLAWEQHIYWTRMVLISIAQRLKDQNAVTNRLLRNPNDIAKIFGQYYSGGVSRTIAQLLSEHLQIGAMLITALRDGKNAEADNLSKQWYINADKMAEAFAGINPYFDREHLQRMLYSHLELTTEEVAMRLSGNYNADIDTFDKVENQALQMADYFSEGIMRQFPQNFN